MARLLVPEPLIGRSYSKYSRGRSASQLANPKVCLLNNQHNFVNIASLHALPIIIDDGESRASPTASSTSLINPFATIMVLQSSKESKMLRDHCFRLTKWTCFEKNWTGRLQPYLTASKAAFKKLWEDKYKG